MTFPCNKIGRSAIVCLALAFLMVALSSGPAQGAASSSLPDIYESDDHYLDAQQIFPGLVQDRSIDQGGADVDWAYFVISEMSDVVVQTSGATGDTVLWLLDEEGAPDYYLAYNDDANGYWSRINYSSLSPGLYYICVAEFDSSVEIPLYHLSLSVVPSGHIAITAPLGGGTQFVGQVCSIMWTFTPAVTDRVDVLLMRSSAVAAVLADDLFNTGSFEWPVAQAAGDGYSLVVRDSDHASISDESAAFTIRAVGPDPFEEDDAPASAKSISSGEVQQRSIDEGGADIDWVFFELMSESDIVLQTSGPAGDTRMWLFAAPVDLDVPLAYNDDSNGYWSRITITVPAGTYFIAVDEFAENEEITTYFLSFTATSLSAATIEVTAPSAGALLSTGSGYTIAWTQTRLSTSMVSIDLYRGGTTMDHFVMAIAEDVNALDGYHIWMVPATLSAGDDYLIAIHSGATVGVGPSFRIEGGTAQADAYEDDDGVAQAKRIAAGEVQRRSIDSGGMDVDWALFTITTESEVLLETSGPAGDTCLWLFASPMDVPLAYNDDANGYWSRISMTLAPGTYYIAVEEYGGSHEIPAYDLTLRVSSGSEQFVWITAPSAGAEWTTGTVASLTWSSSGLSANVRIDLLSNGQTATTLAVQTANDGEFAWAIPATLAVGTYQIKISDSVSTSIRAISEEFRILGADGDTYEQDNTPEEASAISVGESQTRSIMAQGRDVDWVRFSLPAAATVTITTSGPAGDTRLWLFASPVDMERPLAFNDDGSGYWSRITISLQAGTYYILVDEYERNDIIPSYRLELAASVQQASSISLTSPVGGEEWQQTTSHLITWTSTGVSGGVKIEAYRGASLYMTLSSDAPNTGTFFWNISSGVTVGTDYRIRVSSALDASVRAESPGSFSVVEMQSTGDAYEVDDTWNQASPIAPGEVQSRSIGAQGRDVDWACFVLSSESDVRLRTGGAAGDTRMWLFPSVVDLQGPLGFNDDDGSTRWSLLAQRLPAGTYYVAVDEYNNDHEIAAYTLSLEVDPVGQGSFVTVSAPNGGETWRAGETRSVAWTFSADSGSTVRIELLRAGTAVLSVASAAPNIGSYSWTVPAGIEAGTDYAMRVTALQASDVSDAPFAMAAAITSEVSWTLLIYVDAENNLEGEAIDDLLEMARIGSGTQVKVIVQMDRIPGYDSRFGDWTGTKRFLVTSGMQPTSASALQDLGELDTGSATTLADFIVWGMGAYPAQNYALVLWDHGGGVSGACWDDTSNTHLSVPDLRRSLQMAAEASGKHLDLIGFDACLMSMAEVAYEIRDQADCLVSSEEVEPGNGWPYDTVLSYLSSNSGIDADQFGTAIVERYIVSYASSGSETLSAVDLSKMAQLKTALSALADVLVAKMSSVRGLLSSSLSAAQAYEYPTNLDLVDLCDEMIRRTTDNEVRSAASTVREAALAAIVAERHNAERPGSHGLAIYFPATQGDYRSTYDALRMTLEGSWDELLRNYYSGPRLNDAFEPDDSPAAASTLAPGQAQMHSIGAVGRDVDWMRFTTTGVANVIVQTSGAEGDTRLWLYSSSDLNNALAFNDDHTDRFSRISITSLPAGTYLVKVDEYGQNEDIPTYEVSLSVTQTAGNWVEVRSPNGAERLSQGMTLQLTWATSASITGGMKLELLRGEQVVLSIASAANNNGTYAWTVPYGMTPADDYVLRVMSAGGVKDVSDRPFSVVDGATILVTSPTASTIVRPGSSMSIRWTSSEGVGDNVSIDLMNGQSVVVTIVQKATNDGEFSWSVPSNIVEGLYTIRVRGVSEQAQGSTPTAFSISSAQAPTLPGVPQSLVPVAGGTSITLTWQAPASNGGSPITGYRVYRATSEGGTFSLIASTSGRNYADTDVAAGQVYWYRISALTAAGEGAQGAAFSATVAKTGSAGGNTLPIILAVVVVAIVLVLIVIMVKRRASGRKRPPRPPAPGTNGPADPQMPSGNAVRSPPPAQAYSYCPSCGAQTHGSDVCRNCGKRVR